MKLFLAISIILNVVGATLLVILALRFSDLTRDTAWIISTSHQSHVAEVLLEARFDNDYYQYSGIYELTRRATKELQLVHKHNFPEVFRVRAEYSAYDLLEIIYSDDYIEELQQYGYSWAQFNNANEAYDYLLSDQAPPIVDPIELSLE